jgi:hypothetical protein
MQKAAAVMRRDVPLLYDHVDSPPADATALQIESAVPEVEVRHAPAGRGHQRARVGEVRYCRKPRVQVPWGSALPRARSDSSMEMGE